MALTSWAALYTDVVRELMARRKDPELLLLMAIAGHSDPLGFCFPGKKTLMNLRHCAEETVKKRRQWLVDEGYIKYSESWNPRRRQMEPEYQISPRCLYLREEIQDYCERVFEGEERDFTLENNFLVTLFSTNVSQTEETESETESDQPQKPDLVSNPKKQNHNQPRASTQKGPQGSTMRRSKKTEQPAAAPQRQQAQDSEPQSAGRDYDALLQTLNYLDDETLAREVKSAVGTSIAQARTAIKTYPRDWVIHWMLKTVQRRDKGELSNPGAWFFKTLAAQSPDKEWDRLDDEDGPGYEEMAV